jgi:hypothetical protein
VIEIYVNKRDIIPREDWKNYIKLLIQQGSRFLASIFKTLKRRTFRRLSHVRVLSVIGALNKKNRDNCYEKHLQD